MGFEAARLRDFYESHRLVFPDPVVSFSICKLILLIYLNNMLQ